MLRVNRSTYYKHYKLKETARDAENKALRQDILTIYARSKKRLGAYKIRQRLIVECGKTISVGRVYRLMKSMTLPKMSTVKPVYTKPVHEHGECINHLDKRFGPIKPNFVWASDITYVRVGGRFCYICVVMDLFSRKIIAYKVGAKIDKQLVMDAFLSAYKKRGMPSGVMFHSDRGSQYTSKDFRKAIDQAGFVQSFSAKGHPYDNAVVESFFKYLKKEELDRNSYSNIKELELALFEYIIGFYNSRRPHSFNTMLAPDEKEMVFENL